MAENKTESRFVKVCPNCLSTKLSVRIFDVGYYYDCKDCGAKEFYPLEFSVEGLKKILEKKALKDKSKNNKLKNKSKSKRKSKLKKVKPKLGS
ncbi:MAG: hypothetical protein NTY48_02230 [Candidatus Diapherotrites archaeon]|nr:hypothetical protein [Candidatus Diapherotrites archaeon]